MFRDSLNFTRKYIGGQLKLLVFFFVPIVMLRKIQKVESANIQSDYKTSQKRADSSCVFTCSGKV